MNTFGVSTHLYHAHRLSREHLLEIAAHGFTCIELDAARTHFDCYNPSAIADLQGWLADARLDLDAVIAPPPDGPEPWNAGALEPVEAALFVARRIPTRVLIVPVGAPKAASKALERIALLAEPLGVTVAVDSRSPSMAAVGSSVTFVERCEAKIGIALDFATAGKGAGLADAIEMAAELLVAARLPADSAIDWMAVMTTLQKVGYESPLTIEPPPRLTPKDALVRARSARQRIEGLMAEG